MATGAIQRCWQRFAALICCCCCRPVAARAWAPATPGPPSARAPAAPADAFAASDTSGDGSIRVGSFLGEHAELAPGVIVGHGRYVLAEKLCDVGYPGQAAQPLPPPSERLLLDQCGTLPSNVGNLVPYEGLARIIKRDLPQLPGVPVATDETMFLPAVYDYSVSFVRRDPLFREDTWKYRWGERLGKGAFGEAWRAVALDAPMREVVLKRLFVEKGDHVRRSGEREIYYGIVLQNHPHIARFVESFEQKAKDGSAGDPLELWLVFHNEGFSLTHHLFSQQSGPAVVEVSRFWWHIKGQTIGEQVIKNVAYQLLQAVAVAHDLNITHRDIKLSNVFVTDTWPFSVRLGDWGSALTLPPSAEVEALYKPVGPSEDDETEGYQPPEVMFDGGLLERARVKKADKWRSSTYDLWSLGVLLLEFILGTRSVFQVDDRHWRRVEHELRQRRVSPRRFEQGRKLQSLFDFCIVPRGVSAGTPLDQLLQQRPPASEPVPLRAPSALAGVPAQCSDAEFSEVLRQRDVSSEGFPSSEGRDLLRRLLEFSPEDRISAREALKHPWFDDGAKLPPLGRTISCSGKTSHRLGHQSSCPQDGDSAPEGRCLDSQEDEEEDSETWVASASEDEQDIAVETETVVANFITPGRALASGCPHLALHISVHSEVGLREEMEDRHYVSNLSGRRNGSDVEAGFFGVYDGHSGDAVAEMLRQTLHRHVAVEPRFPQNISASLRSAFDSVDTAVHAQHQRSTGDVVADPGSTALVGVAAACRLHLANLGDCRAVVARRDAGFGVESLQAWPLGARVEVKETPNVDLRGQRGVIVEIRSALHRIHVVKLLRDGTLRPFRQSALRLISELRAVRLTVDHKPGAEGERRRIEALGGSVEKPSTADGPWRVAGLATSRSLGSLEARPYVSAEPEITEHTMEPDQDVFFVAASDGIWDVLDDQLVVDLVWDQLSSAHDLRRDPAEVLEGASQLVVQTALERGSLDNLTCAVVLLTWAACMRGGGSCADSTTSKSSAGATAVA